MDREHPIPQEVSTYEFRLVGDMTIKQFMQVAAGALIALLLYSTNIAPYVKWPLIVISFMSGIALAFFPIQDRPLSKWIVLFVKAIYSPTVYVWDKNAKEHQYFAPEDSNIPAAPGVMLNSQQTVAPLPQAPTEIGGESAAEESKLDQTEEAFLEKLDSQFSKPTFQTQNSNNINDQSGGSKSSQSDVKIPETGKIDVEQKDNISQTVAPETSQTTDVGSELSPQSSQSSGLPAKAAIFSTEASPPSPPTRPNVVVGQVLDSEGKLVAGAILEIVDNNGRSVRALRSNNLGHFMIVTPLLNGDYKITVEKEGYEFEPVTFEAKDRIIPPIAIWAKGEAEKQVNQVSPANEENLNNTEKNAILIKPVSETITEQNVIPETQKNQISQNPSGDLYSAQDKPGNQQN